MKYLFLLASRLDRNFGYTNLDIVFRMFRWRMEQLIHSGFSWINNKWFAVHWKYEAHIFQYFIHSLTSEYLKGWHFNKLNNWVLLKSQCRKYVIIYISPVVQTNKSIKWKYENKWELLAFAIEIYSTKRFHSKFNFRSE